MPNAKDQFHDQLAHGFDCTPGGVSKAPATESVLSPRELEILHLLSVGSPYKEVAAKLGIGEETVKTHSRNAQVKLGARNRTHAVCEAIRSRLIP